MPLEVGQTRQLFIDDHVIESRSGLDRIMHTPQRHPSNPVLIGERPWEKWVVEVDGRPMVYDDQTRELRMYYVAPLHDPSAPGKIRYKTCLVVSQDGVRWERLDLGLVDWEGSRHNNILPWGENWMRRPNVIIDPADPDPGRRYKMTFVDVIGGRTAITKGYSSDGIHWKLNGDGKPWFREHHNLNLLGWDPRIRQYVLFPRMPGRPNSVGRSTSTDFVSWSEPTTVIAPGPEDGGRDFKGNAAFLYEGLYLGMLWVFDHNRTAEAELTVSRDGIEWQRVSPGKYFFPRGAADAWDCEMILPNAPVVRDDRIWIYYTGWNIPYEEEAMVRTHQGWVENGRRMQRAIGVATLRLDGFVSLRAGEASGTLVTTELSCPGGALQVNGDVRGELKVDVLDQSGTPVPGFGADSVVIRGDNLRHPVRWKRNQILDSLRGRPVKLRFTLKDANLYSFAFQSAQNSN
jgi:hypothetical protein